MNVRAFLAALLMFLASSALAQQPPRVGPVDTRTYGAVPFRPSGATVDRSVAERFGDIVNVKDYGAKGNTRVDESCSITASTTTVTCSTATFTAADVGKYYYLQGSGAAGVPQLGTITGFTSATQVTVSVTAAQATPRSGIFHGPALPITVANGGGSYGASPQTLTITGGTCTTQPQVSVSTLGAIVTSVLSVVNPGVCTIVPPTGSATTGGGGTGATFNTSGFQIRGRFIYGNDDTAAIIAAFSFNVACGKTVVFPSGAYWLATQTAPITIPTNTTIKGDGLVGFGNVIDNGSMLLVSNKTTTTFLPSQGMTWDGVGVYYPEQDGTQTTPVTFPPLFQDGLLNATITNSRFVNPFQLIKVGPTGNIGRLTFSNNKTYCIDTCFWLLNGMAEVLAITADNVFGPQVFDNNANYGPAWLSRYSASFANLFLLDVGGGTYASVDNVMVTGPLVRGMRFFARLLSGMLNRSDFEAVRLEGTQTALSAEGTAVIQNVNWIGGRIDATNAYDLSQNNSVFMFSSTTGASTLNISGVMELSALGSFVSDSAGALTNLTMTGNQLSNFGRSTTISSYGGILAVAGDATFNVSGNAFDCGRSLPSSLFGVVVNGIGTNSISGNTFKSCTWPIVTTGPSGGATTITGNSGVGTGQQFITDNYAGNSYVVVDSNVSDVTSALRVPVVSTCGTTPTVASGSAWQRGTVNVGSGSATACTLTFASALRTVPFCTVDTGSASVSSAITTGPTTTGFTASFSTNLAGGKMHYRCSL